MKVFRAFVVLLVTCSVFLQQVQAQALPVASFAVNRAMASVITKVAVQRGFAANDPRIAATLTAVGSSNTALNVVSGVSGIGLAVAGAPMWATIAAGLGVFAAGSAAVAYFSSDSSTPSVPRQTPGTEEKAILIDNLGVTVTGEKLSVANAPPLKLPQTQSYQTKDGVRYKPISWLQAFTQFVYVYQSSTCKAPDACTILPKLPANHGYDFIFTDHGFTYGTNNLANFSAGYRAGQYLSNGVEFDERKGYTTRYADPEKKIPQWIDAGWFIDSMGNVKTFVDLNYRMYNPIDGSYYYAPHRTEQYVSGLTVSAKYKSLNGRLDDIYSDIPEEAMNAQLTPEFIANLANAGWRNAASKPGYEGLPYTQNQPITTADVLQWAQQNPQAIPALRDLLSPANNPGTTTVIISPTVQPGTNPDPGTNPGTNPGPGSDVNVVNTPNVNVVNKIQVDLGADPNIASPGLGDPPTAKSILDPILNLMPDLKSWAAPSHVSKCPRPVFDFFGTDIRMDSMCDLFEQNRELIFGLMLAAFAIAALMIVLTA